jgi:hypothetical protein
MAAAREKRTWPGRRTRLGSLPRDRWGALPSVPAADLDAIESVALPGLKARDLSHARSEMPWRGSRSPGGSSLSQGTNSGSARPDCRILAMRNTPGWPTGRTELETIGSVGPRRSGRTGGVTALLREATPTTGCPRGYRARPWQPVVSVAQARQEHSRQPPRVVHDLLVEVGLGLDVQPGSSPTAAGARPTGSNCS